MKRAIFFLLITINSVWALETPFNNGVNITGWFQAPSVGQIQFTKYTKQDLIDIKELGCDVVRLPINLHAMTSGSPDYVIDPLLFTFLDEVVDWAEELELYLILDNHSLEDVNTPTNVGNVLIPIWTQMANHYKNRSKYICYEILNEPHGITDQVWNNIQGTVIDAIRSVDIFHSIIVGPANSNSYENLDEMPWYTDDNLIFTFHFYDPYLFTHQGTDWTSPSLKNLAGMPFPFSPYNMPELPEELEWTWVQSAYQVYDGDGSLSNIYDLIDKIVDFKEARHAAVFCGEFGTYRKTAIDAHRDIWYFMIRMLFDFNNISWAVTDYKGDFGVFRKDTFELYGYHLNVKLSKLLGFYASEQNIYWPYPELGGFDIYKDFVGQNIIESSKLGASQLNYYSDVSPAYGDFCMNFKGVPQYGKVSMRFVPTKDFSQLISGGYAIDFYVRATDPTTEFAIRFVDTKEDNEYYPDDHPWRIAYKIDNSIATWDGSWKHIHIPLANFVEQGSFDDGQWYNPEGLFNWYKVDRFEIVAEYGDITGTGLCFDNIRIVSPAP